MMRRVILSLGLAFHLALAAPLCAQPGTASGDLLAREPETPQETYQAAVTMLQLARPELARQYLAAFLASDPDDATLFAIRDQHGTATFMQMSRIEELQPEANQLLDRLNTAASNQLADPAFQNSLVQGLLGTPRQRQSSLDILRALGDQAAPLLIQRLAAGATPEEEVQLMQALLNLGVNRSGPPLAACLASPNEHLRGIAAELLGRMDAKFAELPLSALAFSPQTSAGVSETARRALARIQLGDPQAVQQVSNLRLVERLKHEARECLGRRAAFPLEDDGLTTLWVWNDEAGTVQAARISPNSAALQRGEEWSRAALELAPSDAEAQALLLAHLMWRDVLTAGWNHSVPTGPGTAHDLALTLPPELVEQTLRLALARDNPAAALVALQVLSHTGSRGSLLLAGSPVLAALDSAEPRLQFAAAETILQLDPQQPFPGSGRVVEILARALHSQRQPKTVIVDPNTDRGAAIAGSISAMGFSPTLARTGQEGFAIAAREGDVELAVLHLNTVQWELSQTLANLRSDPRTKRIPVAVYGPTELRRATAAKLRPYRLVSYLDDSADPGMVQRQLSPLIAARTVPELTDPQRARQMEAAAFWLRHIAEGQRTKVFPLEPAEPALLSKAGEPGTVGRNALIALGTIGKPRVQQRLAEVALSMGLAEETRRAAVVQLAFHVQKFGRMLDNTTAQQVATAYQQEPSPEMKTAWGAVVGALRPSTQVAPSQLLGHPRPAAPLP